MSAVRALDECDPLQVEVAPERGRFISIESVPSCAKALSEDFHDAASLREP